MKNLRLTIATIALGFAAVAVHFLIMANFFPLFVEQNEKNSPIYHYYAQAFLHHINEHISHFNFHVTLGLVLALTGIFQLSKHMRMKFRKAHKIIGCTYVILGLLTIFGGFFLTRDSYGGLTTAFSFFTLGVLWIFFTVKSLVHLYRGDHKSHGISNMQGFTLAVSFFFSRPYLILEHLFFPSTPYDSLFPIAMWLSVATGLCICIYIEQNRSKV